MLTTLSRESLLKQTGPSFRNRIEPESRINRCSECIHRHTCIPREVMPQDMHALEALGPITRRVPHEAALYRANDPFSALFAVRSGSFKSVVISRSGESKVTGFHMPGDIVGAEGIYTQRYHYSVIALEDSEVCRIPYDNLMECASSMPGMQGGLLRIMSGDISRDNGLVVLLGAMSAEERVVAFLLSLSRRYAALRYSLDHFVLRMTRADIGSYLGLSLETVSRVFTHLAHDGLIAVDRRDVVLKDLEGLKARFDSW